MICTMDKEDGGVELENMMNVFFLSGYPIISVFQGYFFLLFSISLPSDA